MAKEFIVLQNFYDGDAGGEGTHFVASNVKHSAEEYSEDKLKKWEKFRFIKFV